MKPRPGPAAPADEAHREAQEALPWLANGTLEDPELARVRAHLETCAPCRADLAALHLVRAAGAGAVPECDAERALARLLPRLDAVGTTAVPVPAQPTVPRRWRDRLAANDRSWLRAAVAVQCCAIAVLAVLLVRQGQDVDARDGTYRVLGAGSTQAGLLVTFKPETPERELRRILGASGARVVGGPTATGAWLLDADGPAAPVLARLRAEPTVAVAEALAPEGGR